MAQSNPIIKYKIIECTISVELNDYIYINSSGIADRALATSLATMPSIGLVIEKVDSTHCIYQESYLIENLSGVVNKGNYYISTTDPGKDQTTLPLTGIVQKVATGIGTTKKDVMINKDFYIRS